MYQIRKCEKITSNLCSEVANLDPEKFRNLSIPFEGETEEDFIIYISQNSYEFYDDDELWNSLDEETQNELGKILEPEMTEYFNSTWKFEDSWFETGKVDETWTKNGGFETIHTTFNGY